MVIEPYKTRQRLPKIALVNDEGIYVDEQGNELSPNLEYKFKRGEIVCFSLWDTAISLTERGIGEFQRWNGKDVRWRSEIYLDEDVWKPRPFDAGILQWPVTPNSSFEDTLNQVVEFRDWLHDEGAKIQCTFGSIATSLLKSKINKPIYTGRGGGYNSPPIEFTRGGRQFIPLNGMGKYEGNISNWDLPAAYASTIGNMHWDGYWCRTTYSHALKAYNRGMPVYCHAVVNIPSGIVGPLPSNFTHAPNPLSSAIQHRFGYPSGQIEGIWTLSELLIAQEAGCEFRPDYCWIMMSSQQPFMEWWQAILRGRELSGDISRSLAKRTGNALWGMFCVDKRTRGKKIAVYYENGQRKIRRLDFSPSNQVPGHDLAEAVSGEIRAKLYEHILAADEHVLSAHTDGIWVRGEYTTPDGWRIKQKAHRIDLLDPQVLRYFITAKDSRVVFAGMPYKLAPEKFQERWEKFEANSGGH